VPQGKLVLLHDNDVATLRDTIVINISDLGVESEVFKTAYFCKDIVEYTAFVYTVWKIHLLDRHLARTDEVSTTFKYSSVTTFANLFPLSIQAHVRERACQ